MRNKAIDILWNTLFLICGIAIGLATQHDYPIIYKFLWVLFGIEFIIFIILMIMIRKNSKEVK